MCAVLSFNPCAVEYTGVIALGPFGIEWLDVDASGGSWASWPFDADYACLLATEVSEGLADFDFESGFVMY